jgi:pyruvate ferredoxin oxidoreductase gamma subunit/2-oxoisovalerate ferredoxin oxidoreductase gamma subunit
MTAAEVLAAAHWSQGKFVQAFPTFQPEKPGATAAAFVRFDDEEIWLRCEMDCADVLIVLDPAVLSTFDISRRLRSGGLMVVNVASSDITAELATNCRTVPVNASQIAINHKLGTRLQPQVNIAILGAYARASGEVPLSAIEDAVAGHIDDREARIQQAVREAYDMASRSLS